MRVTLGQIKIAESALMNLSNQALPIQTSYKISRVIKQVVSEIADLEKHRIILVEQYGTQDVDTTTITVAPENIREFTEAIRPLLETEINLNFDKMSIKDIPDTVLISSADIIALEPFIDFDK